MNENKRGGGAKRSHEGGVPSLGARARHKNLVKSIREKWGYKPETQAQVHRMIHEGKIEDYLHQAIKGNDWSGLKEYFDFFLPARHSGAIISTFKSRLRRDMNPPPGSFDRIVDDLISVARSLLKELRRHNRKLPRGSIKEVIERAAEQNYVILEKIPSHKYKYIQKQVGRKKWEPRLRAWPKKR